ncbi:hypothetical protein PGTUg99_031780 [Puccinia graminis f. sp. tritici]|uniref:Uncharacterized protein n=1 Tax=Puccinia graminis f. sp. tritici TaxID=56615 RepID=A0A5B0MIJ5_PUCGR|nr:hypothetical protein PGTUg99_031780 [Puccinia graminis f. sp. tritici]
MSNRSAPPPDPDSHDEPQRVGVPLSYPRQADCTNQLTRVHPSETHSVRAAHCKPMAGRRQTTHALSVAVKLQAV